jgi:hypothetical protein
MDALAASRWMTNIRAIFLLRSIAYIPLVAACLTVAFLSASTTAAEDRWADERVAGPFICHADFSLDEHPNLLAELAQLQRDVTRTLGVAESREPVHLHLFARKSTYQSYLKAYFPNLVYRRAMFIKGRGPGMVFAYRSGDFEVDVRHESTHALLHASLPMVPLWLDEGLAEYFEVPPDERAFDSPHLLGVKWSARLGLIPQMEKLDEIREVSEMSIAQYRQAWAWVHFMLHGPPEARDELVRYLADIQAHSPPGRLGERLRRRLPDLDQKMADHFTGWKR